MPIRVKLALLFLTLTIIPVAFISVYIFSRSQSALMDSYSSRLEQIAYFKANKLEDFFQQLRGSIQIAQSYYNIKTNLPVVSQYFQDRNAPEYIKAKEMLDAQLKAWLKIKKELVDFMLVGTDGKIVYSVNATHSQLDAGSLLPDISDRVFEHGEKGVHMSPVFENFQPGLGYAFGVLISAPVQDNSGKFIGEIVFEISMDAINEFVQDTSGLGATGETLVVKEEVNGELVFLNRLRHDKNFPLGKRIFPQGSIAEPARRSAQGETGVGIKKDYRGKDVFAAWRYMPSLDWGLVAKVDLEEITRPVRQLAWMAVWVVLCVLALVMIIAWMVAQSITEPVRRLQLGAKIIGAGNLEYKVGQNTKDEIGELSLAFDQMTQNLKTVLASRDELNAEIWLKEAAEGQVRQLVRAVEQSPASIMITDMNADIEYVNPKFSRITGYTAEEVKGVNARIMRSGEHSTAFYKGMFDAILAGNEWRGEFHNKRKDGSLYWESASISAIKDAAGHFTRIIAVKEDISDRKYMEDSLKRSNAELENFAYIVSHDLKAPLRGISSIATWLQEDFADKLDDDGKHQLALLTSRAIRMDALISGILEYSKIGRVQEDESSEAIGPLVKEVVDSLNVPAHVYIDVNGSFPTVKCVRIRLYQIFQNLLSNAIKSMNKERGEIRISCSDKNDRWQWCVEDNGCGIQREHFERIFKLFQTLDAHVKVENTGIGLALVKRIVELRGGNVWVESEVGQGSRFFFTWLK